MQHTSSTKHNLELLLDWLQIQLATYTSISIVGPIIPDFHHDTAFCGSLLLCLAHRYFPHALPDLIVRIGNQEQSNTRIAQLLFLKHWNLAPSSNMLSFFSDLYVAATSTNHDVTTTTTSSQPQTALHLLLEFVHAKLFRSSVLDNGWLEKLEQIMSHSAGMLEALPDHHDAAVLRLKYDYLHGWLVQLRCWSDHGQGLYHSLRTSTPIRKASVDALHEQNPLSLSQLVHHQLSVQPLGAYHRHQFLQRRQKYSNYEKTLEATWLDQCDRATDDLTPDAFYAAQRAHAIFSGSATAAASSSHDSNRRYRALVSRYNNHQNTERRTALEADHRHSLDSFLARSDALVSQGATLKQDLDTCDLEEAQRRLVAFEDDVHVLTERIAPRIPFPGHMDTAEAHYTVSRHKAGLWALQNTLQNAFEGRRQKHRLAQQDAQRAHEVALAMLWIESREKAIREADAGLEVPGLEKHDLETLMREEEAHHSAIVTFKLTTLRNLGENHVVVDAYDKLTNTDLNHREALQAYRARLENEAAYAEVSEDFATKIKAIWRVIMPLEDGNSLDTSSSFDPSDSTTTSEPWPPWLFRQGQQYRELVDYGKRMMQYRGRVIVHIKRGQDLRMEGVQYCGDLEEALTTLMTTQSPPPSSEALTEYLGRVEEFKNAHGHLNKPNCSVEARSTRPEPYLSSAADADLLELHRTLSSVAQSVAQNHQKYTDALDLKHQIDRCVGRAEECARAIQAVSLAYPLEEHERAAITDMLESVTEIGNDVRILAARCTGVVHPQQVVTSLEGLERLAANLTQAMERTSLEGEAAEAEAAWEAACKTACDDPGSLDKMKRTYLDMDRAFTRAGWDVTLVRARQTRLENEITCLAEKQAKEVRARANQALLREWDDQLETAIAEIEEHEHAIQSIMDTCEVSLVPNDDGLEALKQAALLLPSPGPDPRVYDFPSESLDPYFAKMFLFEERKTNGLAKRYAQAHAINTECHQIQRTCVAMDAFDGSTQALLAIQTEVARLSGRGQRILKHRLALLEDQHKAIESEMNLRARRAESEAIINQCSCRLDTLAMSVDEDHLPQEITIVINQTLAELTDPEDLEAVQALNASAFQELERRKEATRHEKRAQAQDRALSKMKAMIDQIEDAQEDHQTTNLVAETTYFGSMKALLKSHPNHTALEDMYNDALRRYKSLEEVVREQTLISDRDRKKHAFEKASAEYLTILKTLGDWACKVRHIRTTDPGQLEALEAQTTQAITECTSKYHEIRGLGAATDQTHDDNITKQFRVTDEMLRDTLAYVNKMKAWSNVREILGEVAGSIHTRNDTGPARLLLSQALARMDDDDVDARMQYMDLFNKVCAVESEQAALAAEKQQEESRRARLSKLRLAADTILASIRASCDTAVAAAATAETIQDVYIAGFATLAQHRAQCSRLQPELDDNVLQDALNEEAAVYDMLEQVGEHARESESILSWIEIQEASKTLSRDRLDALASRIDRFRAMPVSCKHVRPQLSMEASVQDRVSLVESAWKGLLERMEDVQSGAARQKRLDQSNAKMDEIEAVLNHAMAQLSHIKWHLSDRDLESMLREPEALALEGRIQTLAERTTAVLKELQDDIDVEPELTVRQDQIDGSIETLYQDIQDTQCRIDNALAISEYLMLSDDIDLMLSIFKDHLGETVPTKHDLLQNMLQTLEAQQKYYQEQIDEKLDAASALVIDDVKLHFEALCDRWASVQQQAQTRIGTLRQRLQRRGRLASFPTTLLTTPSTSSSLTPRPGRLLPPRPGRHTKAQQYQPDPTNALDLEIGRIVNATQCGVKVEMVPGESGKYYFGLRHPRLVYCRILKSGMVMVRVGGGWCELSQFLRDHALLEENITCIQDSRAPVLQGFFSTAQRPSLPPQLNRSNSTSTISSTNSTSSATSSSATGYLVDGNKYMAVDHLGNYHAVRMTKAANLPSTSSGYRSVHMK